MAEQKKKTKEQRRARRKTMEPKPISKELLEAQVRIAALERVLIPVARRSLKYALPAKNRPETMVTLTMRAGDLKELREVVAGNKERNHEEYPDFVTIARHTIEDFGNALLTPGVLAHEFDIAFEAGYEHRRGEDLAIAQGKEVDRDD